MAGEPPRILNRRYRLVRVVGTGGLGTLFRAEDRRRGGAAVAVKLLHAETCSPATLAQLRHEFRLLASLDHPGLARVHDFEQDAETGEWFFTAELVDGVDLLAATDGLAPEAVYPLLAQLCRTLDYVHARGLVHLDVKPANVLVAGTGAGAVVKLVDFDLAGPATGLGKHAPGIQVPAHPPPRPEPAPPHPNPLVSGERGPISGRRREDPDPLLTWIAPEGTEPRAVCGTLEYIAPEVVRCAPVDARADLYSLGVTLHEIFFRRLPFADATGLELLRRHLYEPARLPEEGASIPAPLRAVIQRLLAKDPADRFARAGDVVRALHWFPPPGAGEEAASAPASRPWLHAGRLVERAGVLEELARLRQAALSAGVERDPAAPGGSETVRLAVISGPTGIGKTRILRELRSASQVEGFRILEGRGRGADQALALWEEAGPAVLPGGAAVVRGVTAPGGGEGAEIRLGSAAEEARADLGARVVAPLLAESVRRPTVLLLDELERVDAESLYLLDFLLRCLAEPHAGDAPHLLLIAALRADEGDDAELPSMLAQLLGRPLVRRMPLAPLTREGTGRLIASMLGAESVEPALAQAVRERVGGVPRRIEEAVRVLTEEGHLRPRAGGWTCPVEAVLRAEVDWSPGGVESRWLHGLSPAVRRLLEVLAVAAGPCPLDRLERVSGLAAAELDPALLRLRREGLVEQAEGRGPLRLSAGPLSSAVYRSMDPERRAADHRLLAADLEGARASGRGAETRREEIARHLERGGRGVDAVAAYVAAAAEARALGAWDGALRCVERAAALVDRAGPADAGLLYEKACVLHGQGRMADAVAALEAGLAAATDVPPPAAAKLQSGPGRGAFLHLLGRIQFERGDLTDAEATLRALEPYPAEREAAVPDLAGVLCARGRHEEAVALCRSAPAGTAVAVAEGKALLGQGRFDEGFTRLTSALAELRVAGAPADAVLEVLREIGAGRVAAGDYGQALACYREALAQATEASRVSAAWALQVDLAYVATQHGDLALATENLEAAEALGRRLGLPAALARVLSNLGTACVAGGRYAEAEHHYRRALALLEHAEDRSAVPGLRTNLAIALAGQDRYAEAEAEYRESLAAAEEARQPLRVVRALGNLANMLLTLGRYDEAAAAADRSTALAETNRLYAHTSYSLLLRAAIALERSETALIPSVAERAVAAARTAGSHRRLAAALVELADARRSIGDLDGAERTLAEAEALAKGIEVRQVRLGTGRARVGLLLDRAGREPERAAGLATRAVTAARECLAALSAQGSLDSAWPLRHLLARALARAGDAAGAAGAYGAAVDALLAMAGHVPEAHRRTFLARPPVLDLLADAAAARCAASAAAPRGGADPPTARAPRATESGTGLTREGVLALGMLSRVLEGGLDLDRMLDLALSSALQCTGAGRGFVVLCEGPGALSVRCARNFDDRSVDSPGFQFSRSICNQVYESRMPFCVEDTQQDAALSARASVASLHIRSVLAVPILRETGVLGVVYLDHQAEPRGFSPADVALVAEFARRIAAPLAHSRAHAQSVAEGTRLRRQLESLAPRFRFDQILGASPPMQKLFHALERVAATDLPVLLQGESGTGKELAARAIHFNGARKERPFVAESCGALATPLLESELFGHVRGAFTGAGGDREGLFAMAHGGTLFLDEVGEMGPDLQKKLLRVLQEGEVRPVGAGHAIRVDCRLIAATHRDLRALVREGRFREDLFFRLGVIEVKIPALRERREDIPLLAQTFLEAAGKETPGARRRFADETLRCLCEYAWPGNVRELQNEVRKLVALGGEVLTPDLLSPGIRPARSVSRSRHGLKERVGEVEREAIRRALEANGWNIRKTAPCLGLNRMSLARRMKKYGLRPPPA